MARRIEHLMADQALRMDAWADRWIAAGLQTGRAHRERFEQAARQCYGFAGLEWPGRLAWVSSPVELAIAAPASALALRLHHHGLLGASTHSALQIAVGEAMTAVVAGQIWRDGHPTLAMNLEVATAGALKGHGSAQPRDRSRPSPESRNADVLSETLEGSVRDKLHEAACLSVAHALQRAVSPVVAQLVEAAIGDVVDGAAGRAQQPGVTAALRFPHCNPPGVSLRDAVKRAMVRAECGALRSGSWHAPAGIYIDETVALAIAQGWPLFHEGQFGCGGRGASPALTSFYREVCGLELEDDLWARAQALEDIAQSVAWWYPHRDFVIACERPVEIHREHAPLRPTRGLGSHRLHRDGGPAIAWSDGWGVHALHGQLVPFWKRQVVEDRASITYECIAAEEDPDLVRLMIERYGRAWYSRHFATAI